jgi:peroxisomal 3,2-trans-enoyl-CoA isomerase
MLIILFFSKIFPQQSVAAFHSTVRVHLLSNLEGLNHDAILAIKKLLRATLRDTSDPDAVNLRESFAQAERFATGVPMQQFKRIAEKEIKHKL